MESLFLPGIVCTQTEQVRSVTRTIRIAVATIVAGFLVEGGTETYQFFSYAYALPVWTGFYYVGLFTTGLGFYLMYLGFHQWAQTHRRSVPQGPRRHWVSLAMFIGGAGTVAVLGAVAGGPGAVGPTDLVASPVGGLVVLAFGNFFLGLAVRMERLVSGVARLMLWSAFAWSIGVAVLTGYVVGNDILELVYEFFTNPLGLIASSAPLAFVIAPLFVTYFLLATAYTDAYLRIRAQSRRSATNPPE